MISNGLSELDEIRLQLLSSMCVQSINQYKFV